MYRFGDGTPFPLRENFIETLVAVVDCCVALYHVEAQVEEHQAHIRDARRRAAEELRRLDALHGLIETAVAPLMAGREQRSGRASEQAAAKIFEASASIIRSTRAGVSRRRETAEHEIVPPRVLGGVPVALGQFFCRHQLPDTEWHARWLAGGEGPATAEIGAHATRELELVFRAALPPDSFWARPIPMAQLFHGPVTALTEGGRGRPRQLRLDPMVLIEVQAMPGREAMVLRESTKRPGSGLHILMPRPGEPGPMVVALDKRDQSRGQPFYIDDLSAGALFGAWRTLERELPQIYASRQELAAARLGGRDVSELEHPAQLGELILMAVAPLVREMRMRSRVPGELTLKRDVSVDRREEMFVPRQALWNKLSVLSPRHRQLFEAIGLSNEATQEFASRVSDKAARARPRQPGAAPPEPVESPPELPTGQSDGFEQDPDLLDPASTLRTPAMDPDSESTSTEPAAEVRDDEGVSEVEVTNPARQDSVSGIIERATG